MRSPYAPRLVMVLAAMLLCAPMAEPVGLAQDGEEEKPVKIKSITVTPSKPGPDTLCRLEVELQNQGGEIASQLAFGVKLNGQELAVYGNQIFMLPVPPKGEATIALFNFWTTESSRSMPADAKMRVEVELREAQWMSVTMESEEGETEKVETWRPLGAVNGLPVSASVILEMSKTAPKR
ncbi:MAG: hypothetical protein OES47_06980 [Acidobacteriota bacterium]|nr:hypothetical protein [Acidobacteriota bacterium]